MSNGCHLLFIHDMFLVSSHSCVHLCMSYCPTIEEHLVIVWSTVMNFIDVSDLTFVSPNNAIISDSCDYLGTQICILVKFGFPRIFN